MIASLYQIAKNTFRENVREPIFLLILLTVLVLIGLLPTMTLFVFREQVKMVVDTAMATMLLGGWVLAVICASHSITQELDSGTAMLVLSKPVERGVFIVGKVIGVLAGLTVFGLLAGLATLVAVRIAKDQFWYDTKGLWLYFAALVASLLGGSLWNFVKRSSFPMNALLCLLVLLPTVAVGIRWIPIDGEFPTYAWRIVPALLLVIFSVWVMGILAVAMSTRFQLVPNLLVCSVVFTVGLLSDYLVGRHAQTSRLAAVVQAALPNWQLLWLADALADEEAVIPTSYLVWSGFYVLMFAGIFVILAMLMFRHREVGRQTVA